MAENAAEINIGTGQLESQIQGLTSLMTTFLSGLQSMQGDIVKGAKDISKVYSDINMDMAHAASVRANQMNDGRDATLEQMAAIKDLTNLSKTSAGDFTKAWATATKQMKGLQEHIEAGTAKAHTTGKLQEYSNLLAKVQEQLTDGMEDLTKLFEDPVSMLDAMAEGTIRLDRLNADQLKQLEAQHGMLKKIQEIDALRSEDDKLLKGYEEQIVQLEAIGDQAKRLNVLAELELKTAMKRKDVAEDVRSMGFSQLGDYVEKATLASIVTKGLKQAVDGLMTSQEEFAHAGNRASGSIDQLTESSAALHGSLGITSSEADGAVKALSGMAVPLDDLKDLAVANAAVAVATGASNEQIAKLQRRMMIFGMTAEDTNKQMDGLAGISREFGLSGNEMNEVMAVSEEMMFNLAGATGKTGEELAALVKEFSELAGVAKRAGVDVSKALRGAADTAKDPLSQVALLGDRFGEYTDALNEGTKAGAKRAQQIRLEAMAEKARDLPKDVMIAGRLAGAYKTTQEELQAAAAMSKEFGKAQEDLNKAAQDKATDVFNERMSTLTKEVSMLLETGVAFLKTFMMPFLWAAGKLLALLNWILTPIRWLIGGLQQLQDWADKTGGVFGGLTTGLLTLIKVVGGLIIFAKAAGYIKSFWGAGAGTIEMLKTWGSHLKGATMSIWKNVAAMGAWIKAKVLGQQVDKAGAAASTLANSASKERLKGAKDFASNFGKGAKAQEAVTKATKAGAAAQKGAAATSAASSTTMAGGNKVLDKSLSWGLIAKLAVLVVIFIALVAVMVLLNPSVGLLLALGAAFIAFAVGMHILSAALAVLATVGSAAIPILFVLGLVFLAFGAAVLMAGYGIKLMGEGAKEGGVHLITVAAALIAIAVAVYIMSAAVALLPLASAAILMFSAVLGMSALSIIFFSWALGGLAEPLDTIGKAAANMTGFKHFTKFRSDVESISTDKLANIAANIAMMGSGLAALVALAGFGVLKHFVSQDNSKSMENQKKQWQNDMKSKADTSNSHLSQIADNTGSINDFSDLTDAIKLLVSKLGSASQQRGSSLSSTGEMGGGW